MALPGSGRLAVASAALLCLVLGSLHAFSVFLAPLETAFGASRAAVSLTYSLALSALTLGVLLGPRLLAGLPASGIVLGAGLVAAAGALLAAASPSLPGVWAAYSLLFGGANGIGYGFGLQIAARANPGREGLAIGLVTASYALGAALAPGLFVAATVAGGFGAAMLGLGLALGAVAPVSALLMRRARLGTGIPAAVSGSVAAAVPAREVAMLWLGYGAAVAAGLMVIGHSAEIARPPGADAALWLAPTLVSGLSMAGSLLGGHLADRLPPGLLLRGLPLAASAILLALVLGGPAAPVLAALAGIGFCYGATIAVYPALIAKTYGLGRSPGLYGRVFTAWGAAGLTAPALAGALFDRTGSYAPALLVAAAFGLASAGVTHLLVTRVWGGRATAPPAPGH